MTEKQLKELGDQLYKPVSDKGIEIGNLMYKSNLSMTLLTARLLELNDYDHILEIGHGNGKHIPKLMELASELEYCGIDISETMHEEASNVLESMNRPSQVELFLYEGENLPFEDAAFHKIMTVNTLYFWKQPVAFLEDIYRVLKPGGQAAITYGIKSYMHKLPFVSHRFKLYSDEDFKNVVQQTSFKRCDITNNCERVMAKTGGYINRFYTIAILTK